MSHFEWVAVLASIIIGLGITELMTGVGRVLKNPDRVTSYWVHGLWVFFQCLSLVYFWWRQYSYDRVEIWTFPLFAFLMIYAAVVYAPSILLFPEKLGEGVDFKTFYYDQRKWFLGHWCAATILGLVESAMKGWDYFHSLGIQNLIGSVTQIGIFLLLISTRNERVHAVGTVASVAYQLWLIAQL